MAGSPLQTRIAELTAEASGGTLSASGALTGSESLTQQGLTSLSYLRLIDAIETEYGIYVDLEEATGRLGTVEKIAEYVREQGVPDA
ncbi:acyl carrier protein [Saccharothrix sp. AJ9571]|nr:acyl carrier protein [Saccharothrix sp. AJ9571]